MRSIFGSGGAVGPPSHGARLWLTPRDGQSNLQLTTTWLIGEWVTTARGCVYLRRGGSCRPPYTDRQAGWRRLGRSEPRAKERTTGWLGGRAGPCRMSFVVAPSWR
jgi:hypothetical protein